MNPWDSLKAIIILLISVILHEYAHGWMAYRLGDSTAKDAGRLTLNPIKHIDPFGSIILPLFLYLSSFNIVLGWAKPVPVNFRNLRNPKKDMMWVGLSGPLTNLGLAVLFSQLLKFNGPLFLQQFFLMGVVTNLILAVFNMIPIPPLDGSRFVIGILSDEWALAYSRLENYGIFIVLLLLYLGLLNSFVWPVVRIVSNILGVAL